MDRPTDDILEEVFRTVPAGEVSTEAIEDLLTRQLNPAEELRLIEEVLKEEHLVEAFGFLWEQLNPTIPEPSPRDTLGHLASLAKARTVGIGRLDALAKDANLPRWLTSEARAYSEAMWLGIETPTPAGSWMQPALDHADLSLETLATWDAVARMVGEAAQEDHPSDEFAERISKQVNVVADQGGVLLTEASAKRGPSGELDDPRPEIQVHLDPANQNLLLTAMLPVNLDQIAEELALVMGFVSKATGETISIVAILRRESGAWTAVVPARAANFTRLFTLAAKYLLIKHRSA